MADILFVMHTMNYTARTQEQQGLEERVGNHMEQRRSVCTATQGNEHQSQLTHRTVGQYFLMSFCFNPISAAMMDVANPIHITTSRAMGDKA